MRQTLRQTFYLTHPFYRAWRQRGPEFVDSGDAGRHSSRRTPSWGSVTTSRGRSDVTARRGRPVTTAADGQQTVCPRRPSDGRPSVTSCDVTHTHTDRVTELRRRVFRRVGVAVSMYCQWLQLKERRGLHLQMGLGWVWDD